MWRHTAAQPFQECSQRAEISAVSVKTRYAKTERCLDVLTCSPLVEQIRYHKCHYVPPCDCCIVSDVKCRLQRFRHIFGYILNVDKHRMPSSVFIFYTRLSRKKVPSAETQCRPIDVVLACPRPIYFANTQLWWHRCCRNLPITMETSCAWDKHPRSQFIAIEPQSSFPRHRTSSL